MTTETKAAALRRLRADGYTTTDDGGGGYEIYRDRERVGRVFSLAGLIAWRPEAIEEQSDDDHGIRSLPPAQPLRPAAAAAPVELHLPGGVRAAYIPESAPPQYAIAGHPIDVDVTIPDDLVRAGWYWCGTTLCWRDPTDPNHIVGVATCTYAPPGWESDRDDCFTVARGIDPQPVTEMRATRPAPAPPKPKRTKPAPAQIEQLTLELA